ncbi:MAG: right-handed parallel beta-helix repeat-containing protein [Phycisphaerales bacterium]|nr:right-handed parallel beta-helix repeat-containing protein [Phycisphaerales bacterium]
MIRDTFVFAASVLAGWLTGSHAARSSDQPSSKPPQVPTATVFLDDDLPVVPTGPLELPVLPPTRSIGGSAAVSTAQRWTRGAFTSIQVNVDANGNNIRGDAANEPTIAVDPTDRSRIAIAWRQFDTIASNFRQAGVGYSHDGGDTWTARTLDPGHFRSDPVLAADSAGNFYFSSLSSVTSADLFRSYDGGVTWLGPVSAFGGDKQWMIVDRTMSPGAGNIYQTWNAQSSCCGNTDFTRSIDGGLTFQSPQSIPAPKIKWGTLDVGPDGTLYIAGSDLGQNTHLFTKSQNAKFRGQTPNFSPISTINLGGFTNSGGPPNPGGLLGQVWIAVDRSNGPTRGNIYVLGSVNPPGPDPLDVMLIRSTDGGQSWSAPIRINDDPTDILAYQWFGTMSVAPNGRIDVIWNDTRNDPFVGFSEVYHSSSIDGGTTWSANVPISVPFNHSLGYPNQYKIGDYYHMVSDISGASLAYAATFNGGQDVYYLRIPGDCNLNGIEDAIEIGNGSVSDCTGNGLPDECEPDCNGNGHADSCDILSGFSPDCAANGMPDECEPDCNGNGHADSCDLADQTSHDLNGNTLPDECEEILYVNAAATGANNGRNWADAYRSLQSALAHAATAPGVVKEIWVAAGRYVPSTNSRQASFQLQSGLALYGGFIGTETARSKRDWVRHRTILSGDLFGNDLPDPLGRSDNSLHVVTASSADSSALLDGFVIAGGNADGAFPDNGGAGLYITSASPTIRNCAIVDNNAFSQGGGVNVATQSSPTFVNCLFATNTAWDGAAFVLNRGSILTLRNCTIADNAAGAFGGGVMASSGTTTLVARDTIFWHNTDFDGSGEFSQISGVTNVFLDYSCIEGLTGFFGGDGNIGDNPLFADPDGPDGTPRTLDDDFRLSLGSTCVNAGDPSAAELPPSDLDGHTRVLCARLDIGAYEFGIGDFNCDQHVNALDFAEFPGCMQGPMVPQGLMLQIAPRQSFFGNPCTAFDSDADGDVDLRDVADFAPTF